MERNKVRVTESRLSVGLTILCFAIAIACFVNTPGTARGAEKYPTSPIDLIVPFSPGGSADLFGRFIAAELSKRWRQPVNVVDKPGGGCVVGTQAVMSAAPNGYTLLLDGPGSSSGQMELKGLPYDILNRTFLARAFLVPEVFVSSIKAQWTSLQELAEIGRRDPSSLTWGAAGGGRSASDYILLHFFQEAGIDASKARKVDFGGTGTALNALAGDHIKLHVASPAAVIPLVSGGKARALGITSPKRCSILPDCPTTREAGFAAVNDFWWVGISGPPGLPTHVQETIIKTIEQIVNDPNVQDRLDKDFNSLTGFLGPEAFKRFVQEESKQIGGLIKFMQGSK